MEKVSEAYVNVLPISKYPTLINKVKIFSKLSYGKLNETLSHTRDTYYYYHNKNLYFVGNKEAIFDALQKNSIKFSELNPTKINLDENFAILRVLIYKAFRSYLIKRGFTWDPHKKNVVFITNPDHKHLEETYQKFRIRLITKITDRFKVHEGFRYNLDIIDEELMLTLFPKVTPLIRASDNFIGKNIILSCSLSCFWKELRKCRYTHKKIPIKSVEIQEKKFALCPEETDRRIIRLTDDEGNTYEVPKHIIHLEAHPSIIRSLGYEYYKKFRKIALKRTYYRLKVLKALLYYISKGNDNIRIPIGRDVNGIVINSNLMTLTINETRNIWKKNELAKI